MRAATVISVEKNVDRAASAVFAAACGYAAYMVGQGAGLPLLGAETAAAVLASYFITARALGAVELASRKAPLSVFDLRSFDPMDADELLLNDPYEPVDVAAHDHFKRAEMLLLKHYKPAEATDEEPLLLDDILAELGPDSRVVRLFDPDAMPTPGELKSRIDRHLEPGESPQVAPDAGQALHDALADLRRSIR